MKAGTVEASVKSADCEGSKLGSTVTELVDSWPTAVLAARCNATSKESVAKDVITAKRLGPPHRRATRRSEPRFQMLCAQQFL